MKQLKSFLKYILPLFIGIALLWYVYKDWNFADILTQLKEVEYTWVIVSVTLFMLSNWFRAYRWNLLLKPLGYKPPVFRTFLAVMVVYFANLLAPRVGEVARCWALKRTDNIPFSASLGSVLAERIFDFFSLLIITIITFILEFDLLHNFMYNIFEGVYNYLMKNILVIYILGSICFILLFSMFAIWRFYKERVFRHTFFQKASELLKDVFSGVSSIRKVDNKFGFLLATLLIWIAYYLMSYLVFFSIPQTAHLGLSAGLAVLVMGGIGMAVPVQGGIGSFHAIVSSVLVLYGISKVDGEFFAFVIHTAESLGMLIFGGLSVLVILLIRQRKEAT